MKKIIIFLLCVHLSLCMRAQQDLGIRNSNYAGIQGALLNPGSIADSKLKWDLNIASAGVVFDNTFLYIPKGSVPAFGFKSIIEGIIHEDKFNTNFDPKNPGKLYNLTFSAEVLGPSFHMDLGTKSVIGFTMASRSYANIRNIPGSTGQNAFDYLKSSDLWNIPSIDHTTKLDGMDWLEYGVNYATVLYRDRRDELKGGISLKYLQGVGAAYVKNTNFNYKIVDTTHILFTASSVDYGRTDYDTYRKIGGYGDLNHGYGFGTDIGFVYVHGREAASGYLYRIGVSFLDLGSINFNRNTAAYHLQTDNADFANWGQAHLKSNIQVDRALSAVFYGGDSSKSQIASHFNMELPAAMSIQADWNLCEKWFLDATIVQGFSHGNRQGVTRPDVYSLTPRYETKWFEASVPLSLLYYGHWQPRMGLAVRLWYFFFGGDAPASLLGLNNMHGVDFYAGIHYFLVRKNP